MERLTPTEMANQYASLFRQLSEEHGEEWVEERIREYLERYGLPDTQFTRWVAIRNIAASRRRVAETREGTLISVRRFTSKSGRDLVAVTLDDGSRYVAGADAYDSIRALVGRKVAVRLNERGFVVAVDDLGEPEVSVELPLIAGTGAVVPVIIIRARRYPGSDGRPGRVRYTMAVFTGDETDVVDVFYATAFEGDVDEPPMGGVHLAVLQARENPRGEIDYVVRRFFPLRREEEEGTEEAGEGGIDIV